MATNKKNNTGAIINRRARFDYHLDDELIVGISLTGKEVRAARDHRVQIQSAFVREQKGELFLTGATFNIKADKGESVADVRDIKLLATRKQIRSLLEAKQKGLTIVATKLIATGRHIKLVIALGKGKKLYDKRETIKRRDLERELGRQLK